MRRGMFRIFYIKKVTVLMLTGMQIAVIGGDARQLEVVRKLTELDAKLLLVGFEQLDHAFTGAVKEKMKDINFNEIDSVILPVRGTDSDGKVETIFSSEEVVLTEEMIKRTPAHCIFYAGISNDYLNAIFKKADRKLVLLFERDDVAIYNSIPTVEGAIMMAIQHTDFTIHGSNVAVLGLKGRYECSPVIPGPWSKSEGGGKKKRRYCEDQ